MRRNLLSRFMATLCLSLALASPSNGIAMTVIPLPDSIRFDVFYLNDTANLNLGVLSSTIGASYLFSSEAVPTMLLPSPTLAAQATQLTNGDLEVIVAGTSTLPGQQTPVELNDKDDIDRVIISLALSDDEPVFAQFFCTCNLAAGCAERSIDGGLSYVEIDNEFVTCSETQQSATMRTTRVEISVNGFEDPSSPPLETGLRIVLSAVPVPPAFWLFGSALGLLGWVKRRSS